MDASLKASIIAIVNSLWQSYYLDRQYKERWVLPPGCKIPFRQLPWHGMKDSAVPINGGAGWLLCSSLDGIRYEIITVEKMVERVVNEYLESKEIDADIKAFCNNLDRKYEGVRAEDAEWIINTAKELFPALKLKTPEPIIDNTPPRHSPFPLDRINSGAVRKRNDWTRNNNTTIMSTKLPIGTIATATMTTQSPRIPTKTPNRSAHPSFKENDKIQARSKFTPIYPQPRHIGGSLESRKGREWKRKESKFAQRVDQMVLNEIEDKPQEPPKSPNRWEWKRKINSAQRIDQMVSNQLEDEPPKEPPESLKSWQSKLKVSKFAQEIKEMAANQATNPSEWKPASEHSEEWVRNDYKKFRIVRPWYAEKAHKESIRWHQIWELLDADGNVQTWSQYDDSEVNNSNVIRETHRNLRYPPKTSSVDTKHRSRIAF